MDTMGQWTGRDARRLRLALRLTVRDFAEDLGVSPRTISKWETGTGGRVPRSELQAALDTALQRATPEQRRRFEQSGEATARPSPSPERASVPVGVSAPRDAAGDSASVVAEAARTAADFAVWWESTSSGPTTAEFALTELRRLAGDYLERSPEPVIHQLCQLRDGLFTLLRRPQAPEQARDLHLLAGFASVLLSWLSGDVGQLGAAETHARLAALFADTARATELQAWVQAVRSKTAFWSGEYPLAVAHASAGLDLVPRTSVRVLLAAQMADAWSLAGAHQQAETALAILAAARDAATDRDTVGGVLACSPAREANYVSGVFQQLGRLTEAARVADTALRLSRTQRVRSYATEAQIQLNRVDVFVDQGDLDAVDEALRTVLGLPPSRRLHTLTQRVGQLSQTLAAPRFARHPLAPSLVEETAAFAVGAAS